MTQEITFKEATVLIESAATTLQKGIESELEAFCDIGCKIICYNGNTELSELKVGEDVVIVNGNLNVTGNIRDCEGVDSSLLIVLGNVTCKNLITLSAIYISGDLKVVHTLLGDSLNDYGCMIGGNLEARTIIEGGHWIKVKGEATFQYLYHSHCEAKDKNGVLKPNLANTNLMENIEKKTEKYKGHSYVPLIQEVQEDGSYDLPKTIKFIEKGGEWFCER